MNTAWWASAEQLDDRQREIISLPLSGSYLITGPPGSGKTNLLLLRAKYLALSAHSNNVMVTFNKSLRNFLRAGCEHYGSSFPSERVHTSVSFFQALLWEFAGRRVPHLDDFDANRNAVVKAVEDLLSRKRLSRVYDVILLDEAQDYTEEELHLFHKLAANLFVVADSRQKIYNTPDSLACLIELVDRHITLRHHYRNGLAICRFADAIAKHTADYVDMASGCNYDELSQPSSVEFHSCSGGDEEIGLMMRRLKEQLRAYPRELIGIISPRRAEGEAVWKAMTALKVQGVVHLQQPDATLSFKDTRLCVCTCHSAKGLEFRALHITGAEHFRAFPYQRNVAFTSVTRAKTSLSLYASGTLPGYLEKAVSTLNATRSPDLAALFGGG